LPSDFGLMLQKLTLIIIGFLSIVVLFWTVVVRTVLKIARPRMVEEALEANEGLAAKKRAEEEAWYTDATPANAADVKEAVSITMNSLKIEAESIRALERAAAAVLVGKATKKQRSMAALRASVATRFEDMAARIDSSAKRGELTKGLCRSAKRMFVDAAAQSPS
jgi:hypothetical protein